MSAYLTLAEYANLSLLPAAYGSITDAIKTSVISARSSLADSFLASQFTLPLTAWADDGFKLAIAAGVDWDLMRRRGFNPEAGGDAAIRTHYEDMWIGAESYMFQVSKGKLTPQVTDSSSGAAAGVSVGSPTVHTDVERGWTNRTEDPETPGDFVDNTD